MTSPVAVLRESSGHDGSRTWHDVWTWCPGCDQLHPFRVVLDGDIGPDPGTPVWGWDGNLERPTFTPSLLVYRCVHLCGPDVQHYEVCPDPEGCGSPGHMVTEDGPAHGLACANRGNCHSFLRDGRWEFLGDSAHHLAGQTVAMVPVPEVWAS